MKHQHDLIRTIDWMVLVILDACRADYFTPYAEYGKYETVRSPGNCTKQWIASVYDTLCKRPSLHYVNANPVVDRTLRKLGGVLDMTSVWKSHWGYFTPLNIPTIHPMSVASTLINHMGGRAPTSQYVIHFVQPHCPYIGAIPLAIGRSGKSTHSLYAACSKLRDPNKAVKQGEVTWDRVREAYAANLRLVWEAVRVVGSVFRGRTVVVTADHGNMLGEGGKFGHLPQWKNSLLYEVPWLVAEGGVLADGEVPSTLNKLEALGYV